MGTLLSVLVYHSAVLIQIISAREYIFVGRDEFYDDSYFTWYKANQYCLEQYGTTLASYNNNISEFNDLLSCIPKHKSVYIGFSKYSFNKTDHFSYDLSIDLYDWRTVNGKDCPSNATHSDGFKLCIHPNDWRYNEPNNMFDNERCAELKYDGQFNDILCDHVDYAWVQGFICDKPHYYNSSDNVQEFCDSTTQTKHNIMDILIALATILTAMLICSITINIKIWHKCKYMQQYLEDNAETSNNTEDSDIGNQSIESSSTSSNNYSHKSSIDQT